MLQEKGSNVVIMRQEEEFSSLRIMKKTLQDADKSLYRVYKGPEEFVTVEAATALEAFRESGIKNPYRIQREIKFKDRLLKQSSLLESQEVIETAGGGVVMAPPAIITPHDEAIPSAKTVVPPAIEAHSEDGALSPADVEALLNGKLP